MKKYLLIIVPSSDDEVYFENCETYKQASRVLTKKFDEAGSAQRFSFKTENERATFLQGYYHGIGYLGEGMFFTNN